MNFFSKIFSPDRKEISLLEDDGHGFEKLNFEEMDSILGGRPLNKQSEEDSKNILRNINRDI